VLCGTDAVCLARHSPSAETPNRKDHAVHKNNAASPAKSNELTANQLDLVNGGIIIIGGLVAPRGTLGGIEGAYLRDPPARN
jgi:hypothetical protein